MNDNMKNILKLNKKDANQAYMKWEPYSEHKLNLPSGKNNSFFNQKRQLCVIEDSSILEQAIKNRLSSEFNGYSINAKKMHEGMLENLKNAKSKYVIWNQVSNYISKITSQDVAKVIEQSVKYLKIRKRIQKIDSKN